MRRRFKQIDVFGVDPFTGNPVAVVLDSDGLSSEQMQGFTQWMNLSETTFLLPPISEAADYRVRIFTLAHELPFAGHPTLGSCHAWLSAGGQPQAPDRIIQECALGLVPITRTGGQLAFAAPPLIREGAVEEGFLRELAEVLGIQRSQVVDAQWVDNGPGWVAILLDDAKSVLAVEPDFRRYEGSHRLDIGLVGPYPDGSPCAFEVRAFFSGEHAEMIEDPVTGSLNASLAQWFLKSGRFPFPYVASQGTRLGRKGRVHLSLDEERVVWVGGQTATRIEGNVEFG